MAKDDYFVIIYDLLKYLYACLKTGDYTNPDMIDSNAYGICESYWLYIIASLKDEGFIKGITIRETKLGTVFTDLRYLQITPRGIAYLYENSLFEKVKKTLKDMKDITLFT